MKDFRFAVAVLAWAAGVMIGSQICPVRADVDPAGSRLLYRETPVGRLAAALVEVADATVGLAVKENLYVNP